jgi:hypothetical protein
VCCDDDDDTRRTSMADDTRSLALRRRPHRPILVVANPGPDSDSDSANEQSAHRPYYYPYSHNDPPSSSPPSPTEKAFPVPLASSREPGPLTTTNLPSHSRPHPASQSNPALSSPSGTSSPPPSTPGQSLPPTDLITDPTSRLAFSAGPSNSSDALLQPQHNTPIHGGSASHIFGKIKAHISIPRIHHDRRLSGSTRTNSVCLFICLRDTVNANQFFSLQPLLFHPTRMLIAPRTMGVPRRWKSP